MNEAVSILSVRVVSKAHEGYLRAGVRLGAGVNEITVSPDQLAAMEADPRLVVTVLAAPDLIDSDDDAKKEGALDSLLDGSGVGGLLPETTLATGTLGGVVETDGTVKSLDDMSLTALKALAKDLGIKGYTGMDKPALVAAIAAEEIQYDGSDDDGKTVAGKQDED